MDQLGRVVVPAVVNSGQTFPLTSQYPFGLSVERPVIVHRFGSLDAKQEQRYYVGIGPSKLQFKHANLNWAEGRQLRDFWESMQGPWKAFKYNVPTPNGTITGTLVTFEQLPISFECLRNAVQVGLNFIEVVDPALAPSYSINSTCLRFPSSALSTALLSEVQQIIPLLHIRVRETAVPDIYLSDRRVTVGGQLYIPRLIGIGEAGSDVLISQDIKGTADNVRFTFGNADRVMTQLANDTDLKYASVDLCLFHVNSGILLQLWKGVIQDFTSDGSANFPISCSDGFFQIMNQYPERQVSRQCWKTFNDGVNCPYSAHGSGGDPTSCDYYLESINGCQAHGMSKYFGGQQADPQGVLIKDDSTGFAGFGRNSVTATSIISETIWGLALPEIWCNSGGNPLYAFMCSPLMVTYRDESTFADSLGIVGAGPIGGYTGSSVVTNADGYRYVVAPMVDGFTWQGFKIDGNLNVKQNQPGMGLRQPIGNDPGNPAYDYFSLGQGTPQVWQPNNYAAGVALCEMRISKSSTIQPSTPDQHKMTVPIDYGMWGWVWDAAGNRNAVKGLVNPFWIAVNMLLRTMGLYGDPSTGSNPAGGSGPSGDAQLGTFVLPSLVVGDGSGAAEIAGAQVPAILGTGTEAQFQFQGTIANQKPFRDWLSEVLNCALGFYTWEFGKLKLGCRINASAVDAYTTTNILFRTLRLNPIAAAFEKVVLSYADVAYAYQANTAEYVDKSHASYYGRAGSPLITQMHSVGCSTLSQALRIAATRTREEIGGVKQTEWRDARVASWQTTLLGLGNEAGQVVSMTDPEIPGIRGTCNVSGATVTWASGDDWDDSLLNKDALINGTQVTITAIASTGDNVTSITVTPAPGDGQGLPFKVITMSFRIQKWTLKKDWSVQLDGQTVTDSMYDLDVGPKPMDVVPAPMPPMLYPIPLGPAWAPYQVQAASWDALFPGEWTFDSNQVYDSLADPSVRASLVITGRLPVTAFSPGAGGPVVGTISQSSTGGSLPANATVRVALCALDANGLPTPPSKILIIGTSDSGADTFTLSNITWPAVTGLTGYVVFASTQDDLICAQASGANTPSSITFAGPLVRSTWALPSPYVAKVRIKAKPYGHFGILGVPVDAVTVPNQITCVQLIDNSGTPPNLVGRILSVIGRPSTSTPFLSVTITAYDPTTGALAVSPNSSLIQVGDIVVVRMRADASNESNPTQISDAGWINSQNNWQGLTPGVEVGQVLRVIQGAGRGQLRKLTGNTATGFSWDIPLLLDETSVWIIESPNWQYQADSIAMGNADYQHQTTLIIPAANFANKPILIAGFTVDINGNESPDGDNPIREDWIFGSPGAFGSSPTAYGVAF
jgi:hypothetical protein